MMNSKQIEHSHTRAAFVWTRMLSVPFWCMLNMMSIILYKDLHVNPLAITFVVALKPLSALLSPYWSTSIYQRKDRLVSNLIWANLLRFSPFLLFPFIDSAWFMILATCIYNVFSRGAIPAWMELFKNNIPETSREKVFAYGSALDYLASAIFPIFFGALLDRYFLAWHWIFPLTAFLGILSTLFIARIPSHLSSLEKQNTDRKEIADWKEKILQPWRQSWNLIKTREDFRFFQLGFMMFGGGGLMIIHAVLPMFFVDTLDLSYTSAMMALTACKGIGFAISSPLWVRLFRKWDLQYFCGVVSVLSLIFTFVLISAQYDLALLYSAYIIYGVMQGGSELGWHMSGPIFAKTEDSSAYSQANILTIGIRGCIFPFLGGALCLGTNAIFVIMVGSLFCMLSTYLLFGYNQSVPTLIKKLD